ncbi:MAG: HD domain-containing protein [Bacillota bacterium]
MNHELKITLDDVREDAELNAYLLKGNEYLGELGYTDHGLRHARLVSDIATNVMIRLDRDPVEEELAGIAGYLHDIGNLINMRDHASASGLMVWQLMRERGMHPEYIGIVAGAVGNHEETYGKIVNPVSAALILADKSDVHRSRVRVKDPAKFDIHDRVNYAAEKSFLNVDADEGTITLQVQVDTEISPVMDYFEIFLTRMLMCRRAAEFLGQRFALHINGMHLL